SPSLSFRPTQSVQTRATSRRTAMKGGSGGAPEKDYHKKELAVDVFFFFSVQALFRYLGCTNTATCALPHVVTAARIFFVLFNTVLVGVYARLLSRARRRTQTPDVAEDIANMEGKLKKALIKIVVLLLLHATLGLMAPLVTSCLPYEDPEQALGLADNLERQKRWTEASQAWTQVLELATPMFGAGHERTVEHQLRLKR
ncbi:unnamed protein product, partial [Symbiodinium microadriaticum]